VRACVLLIEGTNCEDDAVSAFEKVGVYAEKVHLKQLTHECMRERWRTLGDYDILFLPGGWSAGDYVRAGAIFASRIKSRLEEELNDFIESGKKVVGVCNGFQVLIEAGILPGFEGISDQPLGVLTMNANARFQCRPTYLKHANKCGITKGIKLGQVMQVPVAHAEGRLTFGEAEEGILRKLGENEQIIFRYCRLDGEPADGVFPYNPNGSASDIAGRSNPEGNVLGMMPHPERVIEPTQMAD